MAGPLLIAAMVIPSVLGIGMSLWQSHEASKQQEQMQQQAQLSQQQFMQQMQPMMNNSQSQMMQSELMAMESGGMSPSLFASQQQALQANGSGGTGYPPTMFPGYSLPGQFTSPQPGQYQVPQNYSQYS